MGRKKRVKRFDDENIGVRIDVLMPWVALAAAKSEKAVLAAPDLIHCSMGCEHMRKRDDIDRAFCRLFDGVGHWSSNDLKHDGVGRVRCKACLRAQTRKIELMAMVELVTGGNIQHTEEPSHVDPCDFCGSMPMLVRLTTGRGLYVCKCGISAQMESKNYGEERNAWNDLQRRLRAGREARKSIKKLVNKCDAASLYRSFLLPLARETEKPGMVDECGRTALWSAMKEFMWELGAISGKARTGWTLPSSVRSRKRKNDPEAECNWKKKSNEETK